MTIDSLGSRSSLPPKQPRVPQAKNQSALFCLLYQENIHPQAQVRVQAPSPHSQRLAWTKAHEQQPSTQEGGKASEIATENKASELNQRKEKDHEQPADVPQVSGLVTLTTEDVSPDKLPDLEVLLSLSEEKIQAAGSDLKSLGLEIQNASDPLLRRSPDALWQAETSNPEQSVIDRFDNLLMMDMKPVEKAIMDVPLPLPERSTLLQTQAVHRSVRDRERYEPVSFMLTSSIDPSSYRLTPQAVLPPSAVVLAEQLQHWIIKDVGHAQLSLKGLGDEPVQVTVSVQGQLAHVVFATDNAQARSWLNNSLDELSALLAHEGLSLSGASVQTSSHGSSQGQAQSQGQGLAQSRADRVVRTASATSNITAADQISAVASWRTNPRAGLDLYV